MTQQQPETEPDTGDLWTTTVHDRLGSDGAHERSLPLSRRGRLFRALPLLPRPGRGDTPPRLDPDVAALLELIGMGEPTMTTALAEIAEIVDRGKAAGISSHAVPHVLQAYVRAVGRITAAEVAALVESLRSVEAKQRATTLDELIDVLLPLSSRGFDLLHRTMLHEALREGSADLIVDTVGSECLAVAMVDLVGSTAYLAATGPDAHERMVDALFNAGQSATAQRPGHIVKYVGDGVFIAAADPVHAGDAALEIVERLQLELPLQARGGIGYGAVVQRAGDLFGLPVNAAHVLTKAARPGTVLLGAEAAALVPAARRGRLRARLLPHPALGEQQVATLHPA